MPFTVTRQTAARRLARRPSRSLVEMQLAQRDYERNVAAARERLTTAQTAATEQFAQQSEQYETRLGQYQSALDAYNQRAADYQRRVDQYINTINEIERARSINTAAGLAQVGGLGSLLGEEDFSRSFPTVPVPKTPEDPGQFTEQFTMQAPKAPSAPSFAEDIAQFEQTAAQEKTRMEREIGERRAGTMRARRRMTDRPLLSGA